MKARLITGEIAEVCEESNGTFSEVRGVGYEPRTFDPSVIVETWFDKIEPETLTTSFDWDAFRNETAAKFASAMCTSIHYSNIENNGLCWGAIQLTDELIHQLKAVKG